MLDNAAAMLRSDDTPPTLWQLSVRVKKSQLYKLLYSVFLLLRQLCFS